MTFNPDNLMTPLQSALWSFLLERHVGPENAQPRAAIFSRFRLLNLRFSAIDDRSLREAVSELVTIYKKAICTSPGNGYYVARTMREKEESINYLKSAGSKFFERARGLEEADPLERQERLL